MNSAQQQNALQVLLEEPAVQVAAGGFASYGLAVSGQVWSWGSNSMGQRGTGTWGWSGAKPALVQRISDGRVAAVRCLSMCFTL